MSALVDNRKYRWRTVIHQLFAEEDKDGRMQQGLLKKIILSALVSLLVIGSFICQPVLAEIRQIQESPNTILYQSRHSLRDRSGKSWQVILFKRVKSGTVAEVNLRLVGFPGVVEFAHPQPLTMTISGDKELKVEDMFAEKSPYPNVGQYNIKDVLLELPTTEKVIMSLPMTSNNTISLSLPIPVILEWQTVANY